VPGAEGGSGRLLLYSVELPPGPGGIGTQTHQMALHLTRLGWRVRVVAPYGLARTDAAAAFDRAQPYSVVRQRSWRWTSVRMAGQFASALGAALAWRPDVLVAAGYSAVWQGAALAKILRRPWMAMGYGTEFLQGGTRGGDMTRAAFGQADAVVLCSRYTERLMNDMGIHPARSVVVHCGADDDVFAPGRGGGELRRRLGLLPGPVLLTVGSVKERKGQDVVIRALPQLLREFPDLVYVVAGRPHPHPEFVELARSLGVSEHVRFLGEVRAEDLPGLYDLSDVFVLVSRQTARGDIEGYGIAVIEAALSGKPAVVARGSGTEETIVDGETGVLAEPGDPADTARALGALLRDPALRLRMGAAARRRASTEGTWAYSVEQCDSVLRSVARLPSTAAAPR